VNDKNTRLVRDLIERGRRVRERLARGRAADTNALRGRALRRGYQLRRSKFRVDPAFNHGQYMLTDGEGRVVLGPRYDASLAEIEAFLAGAGGCSSNGGGTSHPIDLSRF